MNNKKTINERLNAIAYGIISTWQLVAKRALAHWRLLAYVVIGVVLASAILSGTVIYFEALRELSLKNSLQKRTAEQLNITVRASRGPTNNEEYGKVSNVVVPLINRHVSWMLRDAVHAGRTPTFYLGNIGSEDTAKDGLDRTFFAFIDDLGERIPLIEGAQPNPGTAVGPGQPLELEALVPLAAMRELGARVGDRFAAVPTISSDIPHVYVTISGAFDWDSANDAELVNFTEDVLQTRTITTDLRLMPFFISRQSFLESLGPSIGSMSGSYFWYIKTDPSLINADNAQLTVAHLSVMARRAVASLQTYSQTTGLDDALIEYDQRLFFSKLPMFIVLILIAFVILYYVATMSSLLVENQRSEVAQFRSRGSDTTQILTVFIMEGAMIALLAAIVAPIIAAFTIGLLGLTPAFFGLTGGGLLSVEISPAAYALSALGGILGFVALMIPAIHASRFAITQQRQQSSRPTALPAFQRYYLDVLLLLVAIFLFRQLTEQGSVVARDVFGAAVADELLLAVPGLVLVASAMVLMRLFPLGMNLISKLFVKVLPVAAAMTVWQMSRQPTHYSRLSLLLILTAGLGIFASSFGTTLQRSFEERILHVSGSDVRVVGVNRSSATDDAALMTGGRFVEEIAYERIPGVDTASAVLSRAGRDLTRQQGGSFELMALNSANFDKVAWFRGDFSDEPLEDLLARIRPDESARASGGIAIPSDAVSIGARVRSDRIRPTLQVVARLTNAIDQQSDYKLGFVSSSDWLNLDVSLADQGREDFLANGPVKLSALYVEQSNLNVTLKPGTVFFDDVHVTTSGGSQVLLDGFDSTDAWSLLKTTENSISDELKPSAEVFDDVAGAAVFTWARGEPLTPRGIFVGDEPPPIKVLASRAFLDRENHRVGDEFEVSVDRARIPVSIVGAVELFPSVTSDLKKYLIADISALNAFATSGVSDQPFLPEDLWIASSTTGAARESLLESVKSVEGFGSVNILDREERFRAKDASVDPLVDAGWRALLFIAFSAVLLLSCLGFLVHAYSSFRSRQVQFALMRTTGLSGGQLMMMMWLEQTIIIAVGLALGTWMGSRLGATIIPFLGHDDFGGRVIPPFIMVIDWTALLITYAVMLVIFAVITLALIILIRRISLARILRIGELG
jgi:hypothetical protein